MIFIYFRHFEDETAKANNKIHKLLPCIVPNTVFDRISRNAVNEIDPIIGREFVCTE